MSTVAKRVKIHTFGSQAFNVPNDEEGRTFLQLMRKYINRPLWRYSARGRGPRLRPGDTHVSFSRSLGIPQHESKWLAVYLGGTGHWGNFSSTLAPTNPASYIGYAKPIPKPTFTFEEQALLDEILEQAEDSHDSEAFYSLFQKLVDI